MTARRIEGLGLASTLLVAAALRLWRLEDNGFGTEYYAAGVRSMLQGGQLFFYNAFDPAGFVSLDKPPVAFWIQTAFATVLGFSGWAIHLPQALAGTASVAILHGLVRRTHRPMAGLIAALLLAVTPIAVAIDRSNNTDSWLIFFLLLAASAALRGRGPAFIASMALLGVAFNVKLLAALVCGPALLAGYLLSVAAFDWRRELGWLTAGGATLAVICLAWPLAFDLAPRDSRPYAGSSTGNSMLELIAIHNGRERFVLERPASPAVAATRVARPEAYDAVPVGPLRLAHPTLAAQFAWLLPIALAGLALGWRRQLASTASWGLWAVTYGVVYSAAGGIFHLYYLAALAPPLAALAGIGAVELWRRSRLTLAAAIMLTAIWQAWIVAGPFGTQTLWLALPAAAALAAATVGIIGRSAAMAAAGLLMALPAASAFSPIFAPGNLMLPSASLARWMGVDDGRGIALSRNHTMPSDDPKLRAFLLAQRGGARFIAATPNALVAAPLIIRTGAPVMAVGGFSGNDPILSLDAFAERVARGEVRFVVLVLIGNPSRRGAAPTRQGDFFRWVVANGVPVRQDLWRSLPREAGRTIQLFDLRPGVPLQSAD